jgi:hypothetical protein
MSTQTTDKQLIENAVSTQTARPRYEVPRIQPVTEQEILNTFQVTQSMMGWWTTSLSDRRLKENVTLVGRDGASGLNLYEFNYINFPELRYRGVMADEVSACSPDAVCYDSAGFARVNYGMLGLEMVQVAS